MYLIQIRKWKLFYSTVIKLMVFSLQSYDKQGYSATPQPFNLPASQTGQIGATAAAPFAPLFIPAMPQQMHQQMHQVCIIPKFNCFARVT